MKIGPFGQRKAGGGRWEVPVPRASAGAHADGSGRSIEGFLIEASHGNGSPFSETYIPYVSVGARE